MAAWMGPWASSRVWDTDVEAERATLAPWAVQKPRFSLSPPEDGSVRRPRPSWCRASASKTWDFCSSPGGERCAVP